MEVGCYFLSLELVESIGELGELDQIFPILLIKGRTRRVKRETRQVDSKYRNSMIYGNSPS